MIPFDTVREMALREDLEKQRLAAWIDEQVPSLKRYSPDRHNEWDGMSEADDGEWIRLEDLLRLLGATKEPI